MSAEPVQTLAAQGFAALLRAHTQTIHREAERSGFVADLLRGRATQTSYALYLANLLGVYEVMEQRLDKAVPGPLAAFAAPGLARAPALRHDLAALSTLDDISRNIAAPDILPEGEAYARSIATASDEELLAHAYARYLGDLSGGQILKPLVARSLGLATDQLTFYDFPGIGDIAAMKTNMRDALDTIVPDSPEAGVILTGAIEAFRRMIDLSEALAIKV